MGGSEHLIQSVNTAASSGHTYSSGLAAKHLERHLSIGSEHVPKKVRLDADLGPTNYANDQPVSATTVHQLQFSTSGYQTQAQVVAATTVTDSMMSHGQPAAGIVQQQHVLQMHPRPLPGRGLNRWGMPNRAAGGLSPAAGHGNRNFGPTVSFLPELYRPCQAS